ARTYLNGIVAQLDRDRRLYYLDMVWKANNRKGYITEMEATAMLKLAKDWDVESDLITMVPFFDYRQQTPLIFTLLILRR
ncbi:MAG: hypothetical protein AAFQ98_12860, partial [Bacteroidota bacterium]